jgi:uncharacterized membrane protein YkvA (DUF1232 family)
MYRLFRFWRLGGQDLRLLWFALRRRDRPAWLLPAAALLCIYALEPLNFAMPILGLVDDFILLPLILRWLVKLLPAEIHYGFNRRSFAPR